MKDSGVPWLGEVPEHWEVRRIRNVAEMRVSNVDKHTKDDELPVRLCNYVDVYKNDRIRVRMSFMRATATSDEIERFRLMSGDVLITKDSEAWNDIGVPALVEEAADDLICGYHLALLRPFHDRLYGDYLFRALQSTSLSYQFHVEANGVTRYGLSHAAIKAIWLPLPPLKEQADIVRVLDHADRRIGRYIRAKQTLIKLLEEQKQAIIHRAVTRGLNPNVRLKPSGVEWLGDVPEHWEVERLGRIAMVFNGTTPSRMEPAYWLGGTIPWLSSGKVNDYVVETPSELVTERALRECSMSIVPKGAVIIGLVGQGKTRAKAAILGINTCINQNLAAIISLNGLTGTYLHHFLTGFYKTLREFGRGGNQEALNCEIVVNWRVSVPPGDEQRIICNYLGGALAGLRKAEQRMGQEISLLREYRTRLIADVVTGKLDVREAAARLLDEAEDETEVLSDAEEGTAQDLDTAVEQADA
ncbi:MAG: restriction endonuclease subunit S [Gemmatimonadaceae bacterium]|nr:restriction endonuclease subunit S [Gemmatimonadaceae bacterium]